METIENQKTIANRRNALQSTGPKTPEGKNKVRWNALKHGLLSKEVVLKEGDGKENEQEFIALLESLQEGYTPEGPIEEMLIERIAVSYWRLRRAIRFETGMLREQLDSFIFDYQNEEDYLGNKFNKSVDYEALRGKELKTIKENEHCIKMLKAGLELSQAHDDKQIAMSIYYHDLIAGQYTSEDSVDADLDEDRFSGDEMTLEEMRAFLLKKGWTDDELRENFIGQDLQGIQKCKERIKELEVQEQVQTLKLSRLPYTKALLQEEDLNRLLRYETAIEKQIYKALHELLRLQSARRGGKPVLPIAVDVDVSEGS